MSHSITPGASVQFLALGLSAVVSLVAVVEDLRYRRISNQLALMLFAVGVLSGTMRHGAAGFLDALAGASLAFLAFLLPYCLGGTGGGDVKLMAGFGALTGWSGVLPAVLLVATVGALVSMLVLACPRPRGYPAPVGIPYAPAIVTGSLLVVISQIGAK